MAARYARIRQAPNLVEANQRRIAYESAVRPRRVGSQGPRDPRKAAYVTPFGIDIASGTLAKTSSTVNGYTALAAAINAGGTGGKVTDTLGSNEIAPLFRFKAAKIVWFRNATVSTSTPTSDVTGLEYLKYNGDRDVCPFGRNLETDNIHDVFNTIKAGLVSNASLKVNRVTLTRENISYQ